MSFVANGPLVSVDEQVLKRGHNITFFYEDFFHYMQRFFKLSFLFQSIALKYLACLSQPN